MSTNQLNNKEKDMEGDDDGDKMLSLNQIGSPQSDATATMIGHSVDRVYSIAKTQAGSRFVQEKLSDKQYFGLFFKELKCHVAELMVDNFEHYAIEALLSHCDDHQRLVLVANLSNPMPQVACHK